MYATKTSVFRFCLFCLCVLTGFSSCASAPAARQSGSAADGPGPTWIRKVADGVDETKYFAAVGQASSQDAADRNAFAELTKRFGQSIQVDEKLTSSYQEMVKSGGAANWTESTSMESAIQTSTSLDALMGSEILERYNDGKTYYSLAAMDKAKSAQMYINVINANLTMIKNLVSMDSSVRNSLEGVARFQSAATVSDINVSYGNVLRQLGAAVPAGVKGGDEFRLEAANITKTIPVAVTVTRDRQNRVQGAIAKSLAGLGFLSGGTGSRYRVTAEVTLSDAPSSGTNVFIRYELTANLIDSDTNTVLIPYTANGREGHQSKENAENRAFTAIENKIASEYTELLRDYLARLLPKK